MAVMDEIGQTDELICVKGPAFAWQHANPQALLQLFVQQSSPLANTLQQKLEERPSTFTAPWSVVIYCDEVTPGN
eukprot:922232-Lingulodinium_polyedra.AAC.1